MSGTLLIDRQRTGQAVGRRLLLAATLVGLVSLLVMLSPCRACAAQLLAEPLGISGAHISNAGAVLDATKIDVHGDGTFVIYGTLDRAEELDAFEFIAPASADATLTMFVRSGTWLGKELPASGLCSAESTVLAEATHGLGGQTRFDWLSFEQVRGESAMSVHVEAGKRYVVTVRRTDTSGASIPYALFLGPSSSLADAGVTASALPAVAQLWLGAYGQRGARAGGIVVAAVLAAILLGSVIRVSIAAKAKRRHAEEPREPESAVEAPEANARAEARADAAQARAAKAAEKAERKREARDARAKARAVAAEARRAKAAEKATRKEEARISAEQARAEAAATAATTPVERAAETSISLGERMRGYTPDDLPVTGDGEA